MSVLTANDLKMLYVFIEFASVKADRVEMYLYVCVWRGFNLGLRQDIDGALTFVQSYDLECDGKGIRDGGGGEREKMSQKSPGTDSPTGTFSKRGEENIQR